MVKMNFYTTLFSVVSRARPTHVIRVYMIPRDTPTPRPRPIIGSGISAVLKVLYVLDDFLILY